MRHYKALNVIDAKTIDQCLPQTQCGQCGYGGCLPYAQALLEGAPHNQCPPGGERVIQKLSRLLGRETLTLNPDNGLYKPKVVASIREAECIGCTKCIQACPVEAIIGTNRLMHTVIPDACTGCELCVEPCPVDCIDLHELPPELQPQRLSDSQLDQQAETYRAQFQTQQARSKKRTYEQKLKHQRNRNAMKAKPASLEEKQDFIAQAIERARLKKTGSRLGGREDER